MFLEFGKVNYTNTQLSTSEIRNIYKQISAVGIFGRGELSTRIQNYPTILLNLGVLLGYGGGDDVIKSITEDIPATEPEIIDFARPLMTTDSTTQTDRTSRKIYGIYAGIHIGF